MKNWQDEFSLSQTRNSCLSCSSSSALLNCRECSEVKAEGKDSQCVNVWKLFFDFCSYTLNSRGECFKRVSERCVIRLNNFIHVNQCNNHK